MTGSTTAWVLSGDGVYSTENAGRSWSDITPNGLSPAGVVAIHFDTASAGWVAAASPADPSSTRGLDVYRTTDGGRAWAVTSVPAKVTVPLANTSFASIDANHTWLATTAQTGTSFSSGSLYATDDGGKSWKQLPDPPVAGQISFASATRGWLAGGTSGGELFETEDGGRSWRRESVQVPDGEAPLGISYDLPVVSSDGNGVLPVLFAGDVGKAAVGVYRTTDGGESWNLGRVVPLRGSVGTGTVPPVATATDARTVVIQDPGLSGITRVSQGSSGVAQNRFAGSGLPSVTALSYGSRDAAMAVLDREVCKEKTDCKTENKLLRTDDGGGTWEAVQLP